MCDVTLVLPVCVYVPRVISLQLAYADYNSGDVKFRLTLKLLHGENLLLRLPGSTCSDWGGLDGSISYPEMCSFC